MLMSRKEVHPYWCILLSRQSHKCWLVHLLMRHPFSSVANDSEHHPTYKNRTDLFTLEFQHCIQQTNWLMDWKGSSLMLIIVLSNTQKTSLHPGWCILVLRMISVKPRKILLITSSQHHCTFQHNWKHSIVGTMYKVLYCGSIFILPLAQFGFPYNVLYSNFN